MTGGYRRVWIGIGIFVAAVIVVQGIRDVVRVERIHAEIDEKADRAAIARLEAQRRGIKASLDNIAMLKSNSIGSPAEQVRRYEELAESECQRVKGLAARIETSLPFLPERVQGTQALRELESAVARIIREAGDCSDVFDRL